MAEHLSGVFNGNIEAFQSNEQLIERDQFILCPLIICLTPELVFKQSLQFASSINANYYQL